ncbi:putative reverse transcriptase domain-containing protein, partial [Tanacetum coccineum]
MSSASSVVTYTSVYTDSEPGRAFWGADDEEIPEGGISRVIVLEYDGLPIQPAHDPDYIPKPIYPEYIPLEDEHEYSAEEQPILPIDSPTAELPGYVTESDPEEDPEEYEDNETEDGLVDYPMDGGDNGDDDDGDSSGDDTDEDEDDEDEDEGEEEHLAPADSTIVIPIDEPIFLPEGTEHVIPPPSTDITIGGEIKKLEIELWNLKVKGNDVPAYTERFQELTLICTKFVANETRTERQSDNKRKADDSSRNNHGHQQQPFKRQNVAKVYNMGTGEKKPYGGSLPKSTGNTNVANNFKKGNWQLPKEMVVLNWEHQGIFKERYWECQKRREKCIGNPEDKVVTGNVLINNRYAIYIYFDTGADRSFISTAFSSLINIAPTPLENCYDVELADGKLVGIDTIIRGCTLNFLNHPFNIDLMPVELGSFDVIIGMDWLRRCHAVIVCDEKLIQVPYENETLTFYGNESSNGRESRLTVISCSKAQEYMAKGFQVFLAQISAKK